MKMVFVKSIVIPKKVFGHSLEVGSDHIEALVKKNYLFMWGSLSGFITPKKQEAKPLYILSNAY
jgi:hypothetical protein